MRQLTFKHNSDRVAGAQPVGSMNYCVSLWASRGEQTIMEV